MTMTKAETLAELLANNRSVKRSISYLETETSERVVSYGELYDRALGILSSFDEGTDLVLFYKHLMVLEGNPEYELHFYETDALSPSQKRYAENQLKLFKAWYRSWSVAVG